MKKFTFSLQQILEIREKLEQEQKIKLAKVAAEYQALVYKKDNLLQKADHDYQDVLYTQEDGKLSIQQLQYMDIRREQTRQYAHSMSPEIKEKLQKMEQEREKYQKTHKDKRALEILKEHKVKQHKILVQRQETSEMDEIAKTLFHNRNDFYEKNT